MWLEPSDLGPRMRQVDPHVVSGPLAHVALSRSHWTSKAAAGFHKHKSSGRCIREVWGPLGFILSVLGSLLKLVSEKG